MSDVTDLLEYKEQKRRLESIAAGKYGLSLGAAEVHQLVQHLAKVVLQQHELITSMSTELATTAMNYQQLQDQFMFVSAQAFCAIEMLKEKNICTAEEFHDLWMKTVNEKILKAQEQQPEGQEELLTDVVEDEVTPE